MGAYVDEARLKQLLDQTFARVGERDDASRAEEPWKTLALVCSAQGVIDNGGLQYFFENDWPKQPSYEEFAAAYERIGESQAANAIRAAVQEMGIENPESNAEARNAYMDQFDPVFTDHDTILIGAPTVWASLVRWAENYLKSQT